MLVTTSRTTKTLKDKGQHIILKATPSSETLCRPYICYPSTPRFSFIAFCREWDIVFSMQPVFQKYFFFKFVTDLKISRKGYTTTWSHFVLCRRRLIVVWGILWFWSGSINLLNMCYNCYGYLYSSYPNSVSCIFYALSNVK